MWHFQYAADSVILFSQANKLNGQMTWRYLYKSYAPSTEVFFCKSFCFITLFAFFMANGLLSVSLSRYVIEQF